MVIKARWGSRCLPAGPSAQTEASRVPFAAMVDYSPLFGSFSVGDRVSLVASLVTFDDGGTNHLMSSVISKNLFHFQGGIPQDKLTYSLLNVRVQQSMPRPILIADESSHVLYHDACSWNSSVTLWRSAQGWVGLVRAFFQ